MDRILKLFEHTVDGVWAVDAEQHIVLWNQAAERLLGYTAEEAIGQACDQLLLGRDPDGRQFCKCGCSIVERAREGQIIESVNMQVQHRNGRTCWIQVSPMTVTTDLDLGRPVVLVNLFRVIGEGSAWPPPLRIHLLGPIVVRRADGSWVGGPLWRRAKVRALLALLALQRGQPVHRSALLAALWPGLDYEAALRNLNTTVYNLRFSLEPTVQRGPESGYIGYDAGCYSLSGGRLHWLDVEAFEAGILKASQQPDPGQATALYQEALSLYQGDFVADLDPDLFDSWRERDRLRARYLAALEALGTLYARQHQDREAAETYLKVLAVDACQERVVQELMRLALRHKDHTTATAHYRRLEHALWRELQTLPSQESCLLFEMAMRGS